MSLIYGKNAVVEYLSAARGALRGTLFIAREPHCRQAKYARERARVLGLKCVDCSRRDLNREYPECHSHQGFILKLWEEDERPLDLPPFDCERELSAAIERGEKPRVFILDQVQDPGNLGAIVRSAAQFDIACIFVPRDKASDFTPAARKSACGGDNFVPVVQVVNLTRLLETLKAMGFWSAAASSGEGNALAAFDFNFPYAIILGSEGRGVRRLLLEKADYTLHIPMTGRIDSLNVSVAAGIIMYARYVEQFLRGKND